MFHGPQIVLFSDDIQRAVAFYVQLGLVETFRVPPEGVPIHVDLVLDGYRIGIASGASTRDDHGLAPVTTGQRAALILWTADTDAAYRHVTEELGAPGLRAPYVWLERLLIAWVEDPDGNPIQIVQHLDAAEPTDRT
jgi:catechol 2,3-dioxygenase-like lactoylglutathione lyase family enzyme